MCDVFFLSKMPVMMLMMVTVGGLVGRSLSVPERSVGGETCSTVTGTSCVFPFRHQGEEHQACTLSGSAVPWCATSTHSDGTLVQNKYGLQLLDTLTEPDRQTHF